MPGPDNNVIALTPRGPKRGTLRCKIYAKKKYARRYIMQVAHRHLVAEATIKNSAEAWKWVKLFQEAATAMYLTFEYENKTRRNDFELDKLNAA